MKKAFFTVSLALMLVIGLFAGSFLDPAPVASAGDTAQPQNSITVQGTSSITVTPTIAYVSIGVATFNKDATIAQSDNAKKMDLVYKALADLGIPKDKIKTVSYDIHPRYNYKDNVSVLAGYDVTNTIQVTTDLAKVSNVLDMTVKQGVNEANSIYFGITDQERDTIYLQALDQAVVSAKAKATAIAKAAGVTVKEPFQIIEGSSASAPPITYLADVKSIRAADAASTPISGGELKVEANITIIYNY
ncbi:SIMPL domain-containing protein [Candidatus Formimonas warabiya]|uniref:DUF541 domain-containing protein n=1 Tax=Formimonas warabiya TaxID=1761012 RepID=A0A3G1KWL9_FORW1|nr:SIMPL domain-containing protein [Candidatus Formimonas warabiya]ATW26842.1 hypothetical protein DCMF_20605 [Candidatus Formimonas warabiya]